MKGKIATVGICYVIIWAAGVSQIFKSIDIFDRVFESSTKVIVRSINFFGITSYVIAFHIPIVIVAIGLSSK